MDKHGIEDGGTWERKGWGRAEGNMVEPQRYQGPALEIIPQAQFIRRRLAGQNKAGRLFTVCKRLPEMKGRDLGLWVLG